MNYPQRNYPQIKWYSCISVREIFNLAIFLNSHINSVVFVSLSFNQRLREQLQDTNAAAEEAAGIRCSFESECHWTWDKALNNTFQVVNGKNVTDTGMQPGPSADNPGDVKDHYAIVCFHTCFFCVSFLFIKFVCLFFQKK